MDSTAVAAPSGTEPAPPVEGALAEWGRLADKLLTVEDDAVDAEVFIVSPVDPAVTYRISRGVCPPVRLCWFTTGSDVRLTRRYLRTCTIGCQAPCMCNGTLPGGRDAEEARVRARGLALITAIFMGLDMRQMSCGRFVGNDHPGTIGCRPVPTHELPVPSKPRVFVVSDDEPF